MEDKIPTMPHGGGVKTRSGSVLSHGNPHLLHDFVLLVEELHLDVSADGERLGELEQQELVFSPGVGGVRGVDLHLQLVHHELRICTQNRETVDPRPAAARAWSGGPDPDSLQVPTVNMGTVSNIILWKSRATGLYCSRFFSR